MAQVARLQRQLGEDVRALKNLNPAFSTDVSTVEDWLKVADAARIQRNEEAIAALKDLAWTAAIKSLKYAVDNKLAVYPINSDDFIAKYNITSQRGKDLVNSLALLNVKDPLWFNNVTKLIEGTKSSYSIATAKPFPDATTAKDWSDYASIVLGAVPGFFKNTSLNRNPLLKDAGLLLADSKFALISVINNITRRVSQAQIEALSQLTADQLKGLKSITDLMQRHVEALSQAKALLGSLPVCTDDATWQLTLQKQRLAAINAGLLGEYNRLQQEHYAVYRTLGFQPCQSGSFPSGRTRAQQYSQTLKTTITTITSCVPPAANNLLEATQIEASSTHDGCYSRDAQGNLFFTSNGDPSNYKPVLSAPSRDSTFTLPPLVVPSSGQGTDVTFESFQGPSSADPTIRYDASKPGPAVSVQWSGLENYGESFLLEGTGPLASTTLFSSSSNDAKISKSPDGTTSIRFGDIKPGRYVLAAHYTRPKVLPAWWGNDPARTEATTESAKVIGYDPEYQIDVRPGMTTYVTPPAACISVEWKGRAAARVAPVASDGIEKSYPIFLSGQQGTKYTTPTGFCGSPGHFYLKVSSMKSGKISGDGGGFPLIPVDLKWGKHTTVRLSEPATGMFTPSALQAGVLLRDSNGTIVADAGHADYDKEWRTQPLFDVFPGTYTLESPGNTFKKIQVVFKAGQITQVQVPPAAAPASQTKKR